MASAGEFGRERLKMDLFRWVCLGVAVVFLAGTSWMINDIRLRVRTSAAIIKEAGGKVNAHLPEIVERSKTTTAVLAKNLPEVVDRVRTSTETVSETLPEVIERVDRTTEVVADLAEDIRQLRELLGGTGVKRDENLVAYTTSVLKFIEQSGGTISEKSLVTRRFKNSRPAAEWAAGKRGLFLVYRVSRVKSKQEMLEWIGKGVWMELPGKEPVPLADWLKQNHPESKALS